MRKLSVYRRHLYLGAVLLLRWMQRKRVRGQAEAVVVAEVVTLIDFGALAWF